MASELEVGSLNTTGNVGVGDSTPTSPGGAARFVEIAGSSASLVLTDSDAATWEWISAGGNLKAAKDGTDKVTIDSSGQVGVGKSPSTNQVTAYGPSVQVGQAAALIGAAGGNNLFLSSNALYNNSDWKLTNAGQAGQLFINTDGSFTFRQERTSGSANDNISWDDALTIDSSGLATFSGGIKSDKGIYGAQVSIGDDATASITPPRNAVLMFVSYNNDSDYPSHNTNVALLWCDTGASRNVAKLSSDGAEVSVFTDTDLSAGGETSSVDNHVNVAVNSGAIQIKNRKGTSLTYWYNFIA